MLMWARCWWQLALDLACANFIYVWSNLLMLHTSLCPDNGTNFSFNKSNMHCWIDHMWNIFSYVFFLIFYFNVVNIMVYETTFRVKIWVNLYIEGSVRYEWVWSLQVSPSHIKLGLLLLPAAWEHFSIIDIFFLTFSLVFLLLSKSYVVMVISLLFLFVW